MPTKQGLQREESLKTDDVSGDEEQVDEEAAAYAEERRTAAWWAKRPSYGEGSGQGGVRPRDCYVCLKLICTPPV